MIKILSLSASPVEQSSTDLILERLARSVSAFIGDKDKTEVNLQKLAGMQYIGCQACGKSPAPDFCFYDDDLTSLYRLLAECDLFLFGSPIYFDSVSAQGKAFIDRCNCFRPPDFENQDPDHDFLKRLKRKRPGAMLLVGGEQGWFEGARRTIAGFFKWIEVTNEGMIIYCSPDYNVKGSALNDDTVLQQIEQLAKKLATILLKKKHE